MRFLKLAFLPLVLYSNGAYADPQQEIKHLLQFVEQTSCTYERNGSLHSGAEAKDHIQKKYEYYEDKVKTAEDFIKYSATESTFSSKKYKIHCANEATINSSDWLLSELQVYRNRQIEKSVP